MKSFSVRLLPEAKLDVRKASRYDGQISKRLGREFVKQVKAATISLSSFAAYEIKFRGLRIYNMKQFPYCVYYMVYDDQNRVEIEAVIHGHAEFPADRLTHGLPEQDS